ncbi:hypothetical protein EI94DRAFT_1806062 [Lactarius quietus]|nr:hypothetical protein EI94DRAFT_1806062 [Lactarius quietus]
MKLTLNSVTLGKHPLSPEEGLTTTNEEGQGRPAYQRSKKHQITDLTHKFPPPLEMTDEDTPTGSHTGSSNVPPGGTTAGGTTAGGTTAGGTTAGQKKLLKKLRRTETLLMEAAAPAGNSSTDTNTNTNTDTDTKSDTKSDMVFVPTQRANLTKAKPTGAFTQRVTHKRPSWSSTEADHGHSNGQGSSTTPSYSWAFQATSSQSEGHQASNSHTATSVQSNGHQETPVPSNGHQEMPAQSNGCQVTNPGTPEVKWPADMNLVIPNSHRIKLREQSEVIQEVISDSLPFLRASIMVDYAFPDVLRTMTFLMHALIAGSAGHPSATALRNRILHDHVFLAKLSSMPRGRISIFRGEVKERCAATVALLINVHNTPTLIADLVERQINDNYNYIFPRRLPNVNLLSAPPLHSQPYQNTVIISVIRALFFTGTANREVPKAMVAIVATALYAAFKEWSTGEYKRSNFTANMYLDVYKGHINTLDVTI